MLRAGVSISEIVERSMNEMKRLLVSCSSPYGSLKWPTLTEFTTGMSLNWMYRSWTESLAKSY